ncbi:basic proline-rich protein-like [Choloepus didactylus]|uniref:basic proline-rich protein-like n=1 Tax=Choloepus didactylus TaxID=27675 RepID=UPI00189E2129|nr:basic proline-rich protein-like [Choloepus didactylus]
MAEAGGSTQDVEEEKERALGLPRREEELRPHLLIIPLHGVSAVSAHPFAGQPPHPGAPRGAPGSLQADSPAKTVNGSAAEGPRAERARKPRGAATPAAARRTPAPNKTRVTRSPARATDGPAQTAPAAAEERSAAPQDALPPGPEPPPRPLPPGAKQGQAQRRGRSRGSDRSSSAGRQRSRRGLRFPRPRPPAGAGAPGTGEPRRLAVSENRRPTA